ncbi:TIGR00282 family metallophosphoesterase [Mycoplasma todarodis]|uniref:TIGR00282 family metallophosphoesterase n=1 Tax=Mycoplasma todarodis TaxID=1937191 RepID=A0A4R0XJE4_9MOLU|nr:TIGR00282 family metallophosphoesterase [Mycoplasma todarodis]TCG10756.1 TIGR00282 family metallophosphoesterase [Mycoplasma todarodis]
MYRKQDKMKVLFIGDIFGKPGLKTVVQELPKLKEKYKIDFVIVQGENISGRKGLIQKDYKKLKDAGVNAFTMGNHVWAKDDIKNILKYNDVIRPYNVSKNYAGKGSIVFDVKGEKLRVTSMMGITFNELRKPWKESHASNFFDALDEIKDQKTDEDYHFIDFHGETTSEKAVFSLYADGLVDAIVGTHTHVQTSDDKILPNGTAFITDVGMTGPKNAAIGADFESVYLKMRYDEMSRFTVSKNDCQVNAVVIELNKKGNKIQRLNYEIK